MEKQDCLNKLAQANALLQSVHVHGKADIAALLAAMNSIEAVMVELAQGRQVEAE